MQSFTRSEPARADPDPPNEHPTDTGAAASMPVPTINLERKATPNPPEETEDPTPPMKTENQSEKGVERKDKTPPMETEGQSEEEDKVPPTEVKPTRMRAVEDEDDDDKDQAMVSVHHWYEYKCIWMSNQSVVQCKEWGTYLSKCIGHRFKS